MKFDTFKNWLLKNPPRLGVILLVVIITLVCIIKYAFDQEVNPIIIFTFWLTIGINIGINWGIEAMKYFYKKGQNNTDYKRSKE